MAVIAASWNRCLTKLLVCASVMVLPALAQAASEDDPWEGFNRPVFVFNDTLDTYALKPLAQGYQAVTPQFLEDGIHNMFSNVGEVGNLANNLLQGKIHAAGVDTSRLIFNTTFGVLGFFDVANKMDLRRSDEDFGQTFAVWGSNSGPYLVLPLLGPSTARDALGKIPDSMLTPYSYISDVPARNTLRAVDVVQTRASLLPLEKLVTGDRYVFVRNAFLQNREFKVTDGQVVDDF
ncbi:MAG: VacJ family lipoprotein [Pseudomonadaceae bacterium]|jgi:phospholipid-binding lipoprotein MlaA|nr:VacJ family lipoprotein [Pseudomonadaceae bacterium]